MLRNAAVHQTEWRDEREPSQERDCEANRTNSLVNDESSLHSSHHEQSEERLPSPAPSFPDVRPSPDAHAPSLSGHGQARTVASPVASHMQRSPSRTQLRRLRDTIDDCSGRTDRLCPAQQVHGSVSRQHVSSCRYRCLDALVPYFDDTFTASLASDLLDAYFIEPGGSLFQSASPYVLSPILRKQSLFDSINPRPTTAALLCTMIWCSAHTAELPLLQVPGTRIKLLKSLYNLSTRLISERDPDSWRRGDGG